MHRDLIRVLRLHHDELNVVLPDELYIALQSVTHLDLSVDMYVELLTLDLSFCELDKASRLS